VLTTKKAIATGWGREGFGENASESLMKVTIEYFDQNTCNDVYEDDEKLEGRGTNWSKMICAGSTNKTGDTCNVRITKKFRLLYYLNSSYVYFLIFKG
jgi:hypothetical protein